MDGIKMPEEIDRHRRRFFGAAAVSVAAAQFGVIGAAQAQSDAAKPADAPAIKSNVSFGALKQVECVSEDSHRIRPNEIDIAHRHER